MAQRAVASRSKTSPTVVTRTIFIENAAIEVFDEQLSLKEIRLDAANPRIQHAVRQKFGDSKPSQKALSELIYTTSGVSGLFKSIRDTGGLQEAIHVKDDGTVAEGNCRAACFIRLATQNPDDPRWKTIPCIRLPSGITARQVAVLQAQVHVAGKIRWRAAQKAGHIHSMHTTLHMDAKAIASAMGMHEKTIKRLLAAYDVWVTKIVPKAKGKDPLKLWSHSEEYFRISDLNDHRSIPANVDWFVDQVVTGKIKKGEDVRKLSRIVKSKAAMRVMEKDDVKRAFSVASKKDPTIDSALLKRIKDTTALLEKASVEDLRLLRDPKPNKLLLGLLAATRNLVDMVNTTAQKKK